MLIIKNISTNLEKYSKNIFCNLGRKNAITARGYFFLDFN